MEKERFATLLRKKRFKKLQKGRLIGAVVCVLLFTAQFVGCLAMAIWAQGQLDDIGTPGYRLLLIAARCTAFALFFGAAMVWAAAWLVTEVTKTRLDYAVFELTERVEKLESQTPETRANDRGQPAHSVEPGPPPNAN